MDTNFSSFDSYSTITVRILYDTEAADTSFAVIVAVAEFKKRSKICSLLCFCRFGSLISPFLPVHLTKSLWIISNLISAFVFYFYKRVLDKRDED